MGVNNRSHPDENGRWGDVKWWGHNLTEVGGGRHLNSHQEGVQETEKAPDSHNEFFSRTATQGTAEQNARHGEVELRLNDCGVVCQRVADEGEMVWCGQNGQA